MQAITTRYFGPTNTKGSRIRVSCQAKTRFYPWNHALNQSANHMAAAKALATELGWNYGPWHGGELPDGKGSVFVCDGKCDETFTVD